MRAANQRSKPGAGHLRELIFNALKAYPNLGPSTRELVESLLVTTGYDEIELQAIIYAASRADWIFMSNERWYRYPEGI